MPTDDERRDVAARLRELDTSRLYDGMDEVCALEDACGCDVGQDWQDMELKDRLAELIEPEPERTCEGHRCEETGEWVSHKCGGSLAGCMFDLVRDGFVCVPNFCPSCRAKVV